MKAANVAIRCEEAELVEQCRRGDREAFGRLVAEHQDRVFNACWRICGNRADAEDLTQEAFVRALQSIDRFGGRSRFYTWVFRIAMNLAISAQRKRKRSPCYSLDQDPSGGPPDGSGTLAGRLPSADAPPDRQAGDREQEALVLKALAGLEEDQRVVVILRDLESFGYEDIAEIQDIPPGTVKLRLHRGRLALREKLRPLRESMSPQ